MFTRTQILYVNHRHSKNQRFYLSTLSMSGSDSWHTTGKFKKHAWNFVSEEFKMWLYPGTKIFLLSYVNAYLISFKSLLFYLYLYTVHPIKDMHSIYWNVNSWRQGLVLFTIIFSALRAVPDP